MRKVIGFVNLHHSPSLGELTSSRPLASTSFLGRYAFIDFVLSNFANSGVNEIGVLVQDHARSLHKHLGFATSWSINTKIGSRVMMQNEQYYNNPRYNHDLNNIRNNDWFLYQSKADYVVIAPAHFVLSIDYRKVIDEHEASGADITMVYTHTDCAKEHFINRDRVTVYKGNITHMSKNKGEEDNCDISLETYVMKKEMLNQILDEAPRISSIFSLNDYIMYKLKTLTIHGYQFKGYVRCFDSLAHYLEYSLELLSYSHRSQLFLDNWPIYTVTHDTPPSKYGENAEVSNSFIANGAIIDGSVTSSIISRSVVVREGAHIKNSILLTETIVTSDIDLEYCIVDKYAKIIHVKELKGEKDAPLYINQGDVI